MRAITNLLIAGLLMVGALSSTAYSQIQNRTFLKLDGIEGESPDARHAREIDVENLSFSVDQTGIRMAGGRGSAARSRFSVITVTKRIDKSSPQLFLRCALGTAIPTAVITVQRSRAEPQDFITITLRNVIVSSLVTNSGSETFESVGLSYTVIEYSYRPQNPDGSLGEPVQVSFNVNSNKVPPAP